MDELIPALEEVLDEVFEKDEYTGEYKANDPVCKVIDSDMLSKLALIYNEMNLGGESDD